MPGIIMSDSALDYRSRAADCRRTAGAAILENVRLRWESSALNWDALAERADRTDAERDRIKADRITTMART